MKVVTSHPAKQVVVYSIVKQLRLRGWLAVHLASVYYDPEKLRYRIWRRLPGVFAERIDQQLQKRSSPGLPPQLVDEAPWLELSLALMMRMPLLGRLLASRKPLRIVDWFHDRRASRWVARQNGVDVVIAFQGAALKTLTAARAINATAILMATHPFNHERIVAQEYARLGQRMKPEPKRRVLDEALAADYIVSASRSTTEALQEFGIPLVRIKEIPYGFDPDGPDSTAPQSTSDGVVRFLFVGKLSIHKGLHTLRAAFDAIPGSDLSLTLVGRPVSDVEVRLIDQWKDKRVRVVDEVDNIADAYRTSDVFVFPSFVEGFGMVILEAMAAGLPVIVTDRCSTVVRDGLDGYVVTAGSTEALREKMVHLANSPRDRLRLGASAKKRAREFTWDRFGLDFGTWLEEVRAKFISADSAGHISCPADTATIRA
jgi:glycosyltransferase involved in cell wall biosynthesis